MPTDAAAEHSIRATVMQTPSPDVLEVLPDQWISVAADGQVLAIRPATTEDRADVALPSSSILIPGLIDTHIHAPQWPQRGAGLDLPLERWLQDYTFPLEARFSDAEFAEEVWESLVPSLLAAGTTTAAYYSSIHTEATALLAAACSRHGQRAFVGRVAMDHPANSPEYYRDPSAAAGIDASRESVHQVRAIDGGRGLVTPIITPRFIPACSDELLDGLGSLASETGAHVQTHCSESIWEHGHVLDRYGVTDTEALDRMGLLRQHTVLAHSVHISGEDRERMIERGAGVAHCPLSNSYFGDGVFPVREHLEAGLRIGLGTDVAGGPEHSMRASCGHAVTSSRMLEAGVEPGGSGPLRPDQRIDLVTAFWMATVGGAQLLGIEAGLLGPGRVFDAVAIDPSTDPSSRFDAAIDKPDDHRRFDRIARGAGSITNVWVNGTMVV